MTSCDKLKENQDIVFELPIISPSFLDDKLMIGDENSNNQPEMKQTNEDNFILQEKGLVHMVINEEKVVKPSLDSSSHTVNMAIITSNSDDSSKVFFPDDHDTVWSESFLQVDLDITLTVKDESSQQDENRRNKETPSRWKQMITTDDWWTMWIGLICFFAAVAITFIVPFELGSMRLKYVIPQPIKWNSNPLEAWDVYNIVGTCSLLLFFLSLYLIAKLATGNLSKESYVVFAKGFFGVAVLAILAFWLGEQSWCKQNGFGYAIWSIVFGIVLGNSPLTAEDRLKTVKTVAKDGEFFIKCSLVLLAVQFKILGQLGLQAIFVAWVESPITLLLSFFIGRKLFGMEIGPTLLIATGATWCGASAISVIASVINAPNKDVVLSIGIVAAGTVIFTFVQPYFAILVGMNERVAGAWIGASVDQTGNVIASAAIISDEATEIAGIVKIVLNSALGLLATIVAFMWQSYQLRLGNQDEDSKKGFSWLYLWDKFPKFVLGYLISSTMLTLLVVEGTANGDALPIAVKSMSKWWFSLAFCGIGINTNLKELYESTRSSGIIKLYLVANTIDIVLAFIFSWWVF